MDPVGNNSDGSFEQTNASPIVPNQRSREKKQSDKGFWIYLACLVVILFLVRVYVVEPFIVQGPSMEPSFQNDNYLFVDRLTYHFSTPQRGDIVIFHLPENWSETLIKRVIGLPGDKVVLSGPIPTITIYNAQHPNGFVLQEPYIAPQDEGGATDMSVTLGPNQYFVMGDNRRVSFDSRGWGVLPSSDIIGRVLLRLYPLNEISVFPAKASYQSNTSSS